MSLHQGNALQILLRRHGPSPSHISLPFAGLRTPLADPSNGKDSLLLQRLTARPEIFREGVAVQGQSLKGLDFAE